MESKKKDGPSYYTASILAIILILTSIVLYGFVLPEMISVEDSWWCLLGSVVATLYPVLLVYLSFKVKDLLQQKNDGVVGEEDDTTI